MSVSPIRAKRQFLSPWWRVGIATATATLVIFLVLLAFVWPSKTAELKHFPIVIVGPKYTTQLPPILAYADKDQFLLTVAPSRSAAVSLIKARKVYGAVILGQNPEILTASANGEIITQVMSEVGIQLQDTISNLPASDAEMPTVVTSDIVPAASTNFDLSVLAFPLVLGGIIGGVFCSIFVPRGLWRVGMLTGYGVFTATVVVLVLHTWLNLLPGSFVTSAALLALVFMSISGVVAGLYVTIGPAGLGIGATYTLLIANPISGLLLPPEFILAPWGTIGQWLAPGAAGTALRSLVYFPATDISPQLGLLISWALIGITLVLLGKRDSVLQAPNSHRKA